jgi:transcriptional regulator PpsR
LETQRQRKTSGTPMNVMPPREIAGMFKAPRDTLGDLDAEIASMLIASASDIAMIVDRKGIIRDLAFGSDDMLREGYGHWLGQAWLETVTVESRPKVEEMMRDASQRTVPRWRQVNHPSRHGGADIPVRYSALQVKDDGSVAVVGRELRSMSALQQKLIEAQLTLERDYAKLRQAETRYRLLFRMASEAIIIADAASLKIVEANPAAASLLGLPSDRITGRNLADVFDEEPMQALQGLLAAARIGNPEKETVITLRTGSAGHSVSASLFRQEKVSHFLIRIAAGAKRDKPLEGRAGELGQIIEKMPDAFVVTDLSQTILTANAAFVDLMQMASEDQVRGKSLERWLGRSGVDFNLLVASVKDNGSIRSFATIARGEYGVTEDVDLSAVFVPGGELPCFAYSIRMTERQRAAENVEGRALPRSVEQLTKLVGRVPLKDLVRESTDLIERLCIEAALELTGDNRASAAEMLGLSRQSLYVKLRRYGLADAGLGENGL